jgi:hypothetical protein
MTVEECRSWLATWGAEWLGKDYPVGARSETVAEYVEKAGTEPLDVAIAALCDTYLAGGAEVRECVRSFVERPQGFHNTLLNYVFRMASVLRRDPSPRWIRLAIAAAAIEDARLDYRDLIVSLIVLRWAAERMGLDSRAEFEALAPLATEGTGKLIVGIPHRSAPDVENTVRQMTVVEWRAAFER